MIEHVTNLDLGVTWEPNAPQAILLTDDRGTAALALNAHHSDPSQHAVVVLWEGCLFRSMGSPNDEGISGHRLFSKGLDTVQWAGEVHHSDLIEALDQQSRVHPQHDPSKFLGSAHHIVLTKEVTVEVVAFSLSILRLPGTTVEAADEALRLQRRPSNA